MTDEPLRPSQSRGGGIVVPLSGLAASRIGLEFGSAADFADGFERALARGGEQGVTLVAALDRGDLAMHLPRVDGPCWNSVPLDRGLGHDQRRPGEARAVPLRCRSRGGSVWSRRQRIYRIYARAGRSMRRR